MFCSSLKKSLEQIGNRLGLVNCIVWTKQSFLIKVEVWLFFSSKVQYHVAFFEEKLQKQHGPLLTANTKVWKNQFVQICTKQCFLKETFLDL